MITVVVAITLNYDPTQKFRASEEVVHALEGVTNKLAQDVRMFTSTPHDVASLLNRQALKEDIFP